jgi:hypothetical protein
MRHALRWFAHHPQHGQATRADKANDEDRCQGEEEHIEDTGDESQLDRPFPKISEPACLTSD